MLNNIFESQVDNIVVALYILLGFSFIIQMLYYISIQARIVLHNRSNRQKYTDKEEPISVIISARDEKENLAELLPILLTQDYPEYEIIVVNDGDDTQTKELLDQLSNKYSNLYFTFSPSHTRQISSKKLSLSLGIKASRHEWLLFTEPSCRPMSKDWLKTMARNFTPDTEIVMGASIYEDDNKWKGRVISLHKLNTWSKYLGSAIAKMPYTAVGKNLAYRKSTFNKHKGFSNHLDILRGEDDIFINNIATRHNTRVESSAHALVKEKAYQSNKGWRDERLSRLFTSKRVKGLGKTLSNTNTLSKHIFAIATLTAITTAILTSNWTLLVIASALAIIKSATYTIVINKLMSSLKQDRRFYLSMPIIVLQMLLINIKNQLIFMTKNKREFMRKAL